MSEVVNSIPPTSPIFPALSFDPRTCQYMIHFHVPNLHLLRPLALLLIRIRSFKCMKTLLFSLDPLIS